MASSFNLKDPATLIGFLIGLVGTIILGFVGAAVALIIVVLIYYFTNKKNVMPAVIGAVVGFVIGIIINLIFGAVISIF
jgi:uncharacterized membrane protein YeaQ/YmgE (transglycosylase-associated protein family)